MTPSTRAEKIDEQAEGLIKEFFEHYEGSKIAKENHHLIKGLSLKAGQSRKLPDCRY